MNQSLNQPMAHSQLPDEPLRQRVRVLYEKGEAIKFISHLDEFRLWERALRRADLPLLYKRGFNPQPHIQFASPLGVGFTGVREPIDITFAPPLALPELRARIQAKLPPGVQIHAIEEVPLKTRALQSLLIGADYAIIIYAEPDEIEPQQIETAIAHLLAQREAWSERERKGAKYRYNLRPLVFELRYEGYDAASEEHRIFLRVQQREGATGRPDEVVSALGLDNFARTLRRERLYTSDNIADEAIFAQYPVVEKADINMDVGRRRKGRHGPKKDDGKPAGKYSREGRSINERASDEFV